LLHLFRRFFPALERYLRECRDDTNGTLRPNKKVVGQVVEYLKREDNVDDEVEKLAFEVEKLKKYRRWVSYRLALPQGHVERAGYVLTIEKVGPNKGKPTSTWVAHLLDKQLNRQWWDLTKRIHRKEQRAKALVRDVQIRMGADLVSRCNLLVVPAFKTQEMVRKVNPMDGSRRRIGSKTAKRMMSMSHYKFQGRLAHLCRITGKTLRIVTEPYTSVSCHKCGICCKRREAVEIISLD